MFAGADGLRGTSPSSDDDDTPRVLVPAGPAAAASDNPGSKSPPGGGKTVGSAARLSAAALIRRSMEFRRSLVLGPARAPSAPANAVSLLSVIECSTKQHFLLLFGMSL